MQAHSFNTTAILLFSNSLIFMYCISVKFRQSNINLICSIFSCHKQNQRTEIYFRKGSRLHHNLQNNQPELESYLYYLCSQISRALSESKHQISCMQGPNAHIPQTQVHQPVLLPLFTLQKRLCFLLTFKRKDLRKCHPSSECK